MRTNSKRTLKCLFMWLLALMVFTGCTGQSSSGKPAEETAQPSADKPKDSLTIALSAGVNTLDVHATNSGPDQAIIRQMTETLLQRDPKTMEYKPGLAESWKQLDDLTLQFKLRQGVTFHNGEPFNAEAVKFSIERIFDPSIKSAHASVLKPIDRVEVVDEYTVNIKTKEPFPLLLTRNTMAFTGSLVMVPPKYVQEKGNAYYAEHPVGTGPYKFKEWAKGEKVVLEANPDYWGNKPQIKEVTFRFIPEASTRVSALLAGDVDFIERLPADLMKRVENSPDSKVVKSESGGYAIMMQLNPDAHPALKDKKVRQALNYAVDINTILNSILGGNTQIMPVPADPNAFGYNPNLKMYPYDPEKAKQLLAEAGYPNGFTIDAYTSNDRYPGDRAIAEAYAAQLAKVGVKVNLTTMEWGKLVGLMGQGQAGPMYQIGWTYSEFDISKLIPALHPSSGYSTFDNEEFAKLADQAEKEMNPEKRKELWWKAQEILVDEAPYIHAWEPYLLYGARKNLDISMIGELFFVSEMKFN